MAVLDIQKVSWTKGETISQKKSAKPVTESIWTIFFVVFYQRLIKRSRAMSPFPKNVDAMSDEINCNFF